MTNLVTASGLQKSYGDLRVLSSVDFEIPRGVTGLLGANGTGKTTILGMILGLHRADAGSLQVLGIDPWSAGPQVRMLLGYAPEHHTLPPDLRAADFVRHVAELHGLPRADATTRASDALWLVGLGEERFRPMGTMSTGQRQRVKLAQAIAHDPQLVLLDEPTDGLDPLQRDNMLDLIKSISVEYGMDIVLSSHVLDEVERVCDGVVIIGDGKTIASGGLAQMQAETRSGVVVELDADERTIGLVAAELGGRFEITAEARTLQITGDEADVRAAVLKTCRQHQVGIVRLHRYVRSLEDVYLREAS